MPSLTPGLPIDDLNRELTKLHLSNSRSRLTAPVSTESPAHESPSRSLPINRSATGPRFVDLIAGSDLDAAAIHSAQAIFANLAEAEATVHGTTPDEVHFHEVGGVDAIVDVCGACIGLALLGVERVYSAPPRLGSGFARSRHGLIPVPAPATAQLLARAKVPTLGPVPGHENGSRRVAHADWRRDPDDARDVCAPRIRADRHWLRFRHREHYPGPMLSVSGLEKPVRRRIPPVTARF